MKPKICTFLLLTAMMFAASAYENANDTYAAAPPDEGCCTQVLPTIAVDTPAYKYLKAEYDFRDYSPNPADRYNPAQVTFASVLVPGAGQFITREWGKGTLFLAGTYTLYATTGLLYNAYQSTKEQYNGLLYASAFTAAAGLGIWIWNIIDANHTAKVKNMYLRDLLGGRTHSKASVSFQPSLDLIPGGSTYNPTAGLAMRLSF